MRNFLAFTALLSAFIFLSKCEPREERIDPNPEEGLRFSSDTVFFDTVFTTVGSITKRLTVYNPNKGAVKINRIRLVSDDPGVAFSIIINGERTREASDLQLLGEDSLLILAEITIDPRDESKPFVLEEKLEFLTAAGLQEVQLVAWGQDAHFLRDSVITCDAVWTNDRPYVIYGNVLVEEGCKLSIDTGVQVHLSPDSYFIVGGSLDVQGLPESPVVFQGTRLDEAYKDAPGQWLGILFGSASKDNSINGAVIKNAVTGIQIGSPDADSVADLRIANSIIKNMADVGVFGIRADIELLNSQISNCLTHTFYGLAGGNYRFFHTTSANYGFDFFRENPSIFITNEAVLNDGAEESEDTELIMVNTIVWGSEEEEIFVLNRGANQTRISLLNNIFRSTQSEFSEGESLISNDPAFLTFTNPREQLFEPDSLSPAVDAAFDIGFRRDVLGNERDESPDIGAYERQKDGE